MLEVEDELDVPDEEEDAGDEVGESDGDGPGLERATAPGRLREEVLLLHDSSSLSSLTEILDGIKVDGITFITIASCFAFLSVFSLSGFLEILFALFFGLFTFLRTEKSRLKSLKMA